MSGYVPYQTMVLNSVSTLYDKVFSYLPNVVWAIIVLILGWIVASFLSTVVLKFLELLQIDKLANQLGLQNLGDKIDRRLSLARFGAWVVKWFFFLASFLGAANILNLNEVGTFLYASVLPYAGQVIIAVAILLLGVLAANFFGGIVSSTIKAGGIQTAETLGAITKWAIIVMSVFAALTKVGIAGDYLHDLFRAIIVMLAISGGIAFGLGGKDHAKKILDSLEDDLTKK